MNPSTRNALLIAAGVGGFLGFRTLRRSLHWLDLRDKVVLITGGSRGLGLVLAREFQRKGAQLAICARDSEELERARYDLERRGRRVLARACDVADRGQVQDLVDTVERAFGRLDVLVNNAGVIQVGPIEHMTQADYEEDMKVHYWGPLWAIQVALPGMRRRHSGRIVNITSIGGRISVPHLVPYDASKFALVGLSQGLRAELVRDNILVTTVTPGLMRTGSPDNASFKGQHRKEYTWFALGDALPVLSMSADCAARQIVDACQAGEAEVILTLPAKLAVRLAGLFPGLTADVLGLVNRFLPAPGGVGRQRVRGRDSHTPVAPSPLTALNDRAAQRNNEVPGPSRLPGRSGQPLTTNR